MGGQTSQERRRTRRKKDERWEAERLMADLTAGLAADRPEG